MYDGIESLREWTGLSTKTEESEIDTETTLPGGTIVIPNPLAQPEVPADPASTEVPVTPSSKTDPVVIPTSDTSKTPVADPVTPDVDPATTVTPSTKPDAPTPVADPSTPSTDPATPSGS